MHESPKVPLSQIIEAARRVWTVTSRTHNPEEDLMDSLLSDIDLSQANFTPGCKEFGIPIIGEWGGYLDVEVPNDVACQLLGKTYSLGMVVNYQNQECIVAAICMSSTVAGYMKRVQMMIDGSLVKSGFDDGEVIPANGYRFDYLALVPASSIELDS